MEQFVKRSLRHESGRKTMSPHRVSVRRILEMVSISIAGLAAVHFVAATGLSAQTASPISDAEIARLVADFKEDPRGPFQAIRWFCPDGSVIGARERCEQPGGIQHGLHKDAVVPLQTRNGVYLGQILAGTPNHTFLDEPRYFSRLKQYQLEQFLIRVDDGWILRKAKFYRGAFQAEDEEAWGKQFLEWILSRPGLTTRWFYTLREATRDLPHQMADNIVQRIRSVSREISDEYGPFLDLRIKIHGQPGASDTTRVLEFRRLHSGRMPPGVAARMEQLVSDLRRQYGTDRWEHLRRLAGRLPVSSDPASLIAGYSTTGKSPQENVVFLSDVLQTTRLSVDQSSRGRERLVLLDLSLAAENLLFSLAGEWEPHTVRQSLGKIYALARAVHGAGLLEHWEWREIEPALTGARESESFSVADFEALVQMVRRVVEWGIGMVTASYGEVVGLYSGFEPLADGFLDDRMRSTVLLALGDELGRLSDKLAEASGRRNEVMGLGSASGIHGLNPGIAVGELVVVAGPTEDLDYSADKIYVLNRAPADLKPVAGIATVSEGNVVSHVQLLARNLGIPNAVISPTLLRALEPSSGLRVFYAVSPGGAVRLKPVEEMTDEERVLVEGRERSEARISVPVVRLNLTDTDLENLYDLRASDSGVVCGPKAANLGQLSSLFPGKVAPGFIVPFGVFRRHMDQAMPASGQTYWEFLRETFDSAEAMRERGEEESRIEADVLSRLATLRSSIEKMPLRAAFVAELRARFPAILGGPVGSVPVFVRSDTNMEDLKDFTGAGLNLTVPNVVLERDLLQAIRRVWASPYRERGYRWRQKYLLNPEDVYPSLLILRSVDVEKSGVMITAGVSSGRPSDVTVAFNRGVGGAVDGQAAETWLLTSAGAVLESPAREPRYTTLPKAGGTERRITPFDQRILTPSDLDALGGLAAEIRRTLQGTPGIETSGPFDVELGFLGGDIKLFQTRPFVENRLAASTIYLTKMDARTGVGLPIGASDELGTGG